MPIKYIGRPATFQGKFLFHILCKLKNFGVGRMVVRDSFNKKYPEPTFYRILKSNPDMADPTMKKGSIVANEVFRGEECPAERLVTATFRPDWRLIPKTEEADYINRMTAGRPRNTVPAFVDFPPLMEELIKQNVTIAGQSVTEKPRLKLVIRQKESNRATQDVESET